MKRPGWERVVCCASGPTFSLEQAERIIVARIRDACRVVVVNVNYQRVPNADVCYGADGAFWKVHLPKMRAAMFDGELWTQDHKAATELGLHWMPWKHGDAPLPVDHEYTSGGRNSGIQGIMLARRFGARRILLVGYDCHDDKHWHGKHARPLSNGNAASFVKHFNKAAPVLAAEGLQVVNCSPGSALQCFERGDLAEELQRFEGQEC